MRSAPRAVKGTRAKRPGKRGEGHSRTPSRAERRPGQPSAGTRHVGARRQRASGLQGRRGPVRGEGEKSETGRGGQRISRTPRKGSRRRVQGPRAPPRALQPGSGPRSNRMARSLRDPRGPPRPARPRRQAVRRRASSAHRQLQHQRAAPRRRPRGWRSPRRSRAGRRRRLTTGAHSPRVFPDAVAPLTEVSRRSSRIALDGGASGFRLAAARPAVIFDAAAGADRTGRQRTSLILRGVTVARVPRPPTVLRAPNPCQRPLTALRGGLRAGARSAWDRSSKPLLLVGLATPAARRLRGPLGGSGNSPANDLACREPRGPSDPASRRRRRCRAQSRGGGRGGHDLVVTDRGAFSEVGVEGLELTPEVGHELRQAACPR